MNTRLDRRTLELREAFDRGFAALPAAEETVSEAFLAIGVGGDAYAIRLAEISGLHVGKKVTWLPGDTPGLLGLTGFRGVPVPVYDLRALLGYPAGPAPRWVALMAPKTPVGLAFDRFDGFLDVPRGSAVRDERPERARPHTSEILGAAGVVRMVIHLPSILEAITNRASRSPSRKE